MSRESRRKQKKERQRRKQAERDARRMYERMLKQAQQQAAAADARIAEQMRIDAANRQKQAEIYNRDLLKVQQKASADLQAMQSQYAQAEKARIERENIAKQQREMQERMALQKKAEAEQLAAAEDKASAANRARAAAGATGLQIQPAGDMSSVAGTPQFKRRKDQFNTAGSYGGLSTIKSGTINI
jgi:membrane protein involved in colicin uptake